MFKEGEHVEVIDGEYRGLEGDVISREEGLRIMGDEPTYPIPADGVWLRFTIFGRTGAVAFAPAQLRRRTN